MSSAVLAQENQYYSFHTFVPYRVGELWGYKIPGRDSIVIKPQFEDADLFSANGLARVKKNGLYGFINRSGDLQIPCKYKHAGVFYNGQTSYPKEIVYVGHDRYIDKKDNLLNFEPEPDELIESGQMLIPNWFKLFAF